LLQRLICWYFYIELDERDPELESVLREDSRGVGAGMAQKLREQIRQTRPFQSKEEEALLNLRRTADCVHRAFQQIMRPYGLTETQYNALRILRGAGDSGLRCSEVGDRLVSHDPDITRLLNRLERRELIHRQRDEKDKRVVYTVISDAGRELLKELDLIVGQSVQSLLGHLSAAKLDSLIDLLEQARDRCDR
jgi:DNA-binding MarR family transcriptional regulator